MITESDPSAEEQTNAGSTDDLIDLDLDSGS